MTAVPSEPTSRPRPPDDHPSRSASQTSVRRKGNPDSFATCLKGDNLGRHWPAFQQ